MKASRLLLALLILILAIALSSCGSSSMCHTYDHHGYGSQKKVHSTKSTIYRGSLSSRVKPHSISSKLNYK